MLSKANIWYAVSKEKGNSLQSYQCVLTSQLTYQWRWRMTGCSAWKEFNRKRKKNSCDRSNSIDIRRKKCYTIHILYFCRGVKWLSVIKNFGNCLLTKIWKRRICRSQQVLAPHLLPSLQKTKTSIPKCYKRYAPRWIVTLGILWKWFLQMKTIN